MVKSPLLLPKRRATNATPALAFDLTAQPSAAQSGGGNNGAQRLQAARASTAWKRLQSMAILSGSDIQNPSQSAWRGMAVIPGPLIRLVRPEHQRA